MKTHAVVSSDGKTRTFTFSGTDLQGHKVHNVVVFEKGDAIATAETQNSEKKQQTPRAQGNVWGACFWQ